MKPSLIILLLAVLTSGCATEYNLRRDLVDVRPEGTVTIFDQGTNQIVILHGSAFPYQYNNLVFCDLYGAKLPMGAEKYYGRIERPGELWMSGKGVYPQYAPQFVITNDAFLGRSFIPTNAVTLKITKAKKRKYTFLSLTRKIVTTPFMMGADVISLGMSGWVYADPKIAVVGEYELVDEKQ